MNKFITLAFFGSSHNSVTVLETLKKASCDIKAVVTAPPRPVGRKKIITQTAVHRFAEENSIPVATPEKLDKRFTEEFRSQPIDVAIVADYAKLIPPEILNHPKHGFLNLHPSLLPKYRGSSPVEAAILAGDEKTGLTIIQMDEQFDHGPIITQFEEEIQSDDSAETLYHRLFSAGAKVLTTILPAWLEGRITPRNQDHSKATLAPRLTRDDGFTAWKTLQKAMKGEDISPKLRPNKLSSVTGHWSQVIERATRAFYAWPGVWTIIPTTKGDKRLKLLSAYLENQKLILDQVQLEGKTPTAWQEISKQILSR